MMSGATSGSVVSGDPHRAHPRRAPRAVPSDEYLAGYLGSDEQIPLISLDCVMKAAGLIERMGRERLGARKEKE